MKRLLYTIYTLLLFTSVCYSETYYRMSQEDYKNLNYKIDEYWRRFELPNQFVDKSQRKTAEIAQRELIEIRNRLERMQDKK